MKKISVLLPTHRNDAYLIEAINSILIQDYKNFELIIISNGLNGPSYVDIMNYCKNDERLVYISTQIAELSFALNLGLHHSSGEYVARMDGDDISEPTRFLDQITFIESNELDACGSNVYLIDSFSNNLGTWVYPIKKNIKWKKYFANPFCHPTLMIKKSVLVSVGGYAGLKYSEDYNLILKILDKFNFDNLQKCTLKYRIHNSHAQKQFQSYVEASSYQFVNFFLKLNFYCLIGSFFWLVKGLLRGKRK